IASQPPKIVPIVVHDNLVEKLCQGEHEIIFDSHIKTLDALKAQLNDKFLYINFINTQGGTSVGMNVDDCSFKKDETGLDQLLSISGHFSLNLTDLKCSISVEIKSMKALAVLTK